MRNTSLGNMTSDDLTSADRVEIIRLAKVSAIKAAQIILQSRDGSKAHTKCNPNDNGHATFNLALREMIEAEKEVKRAMSSTHSERWSLCIEIFLKTVDEDIMTLETWNISLVGGCNDNSKICRYTLAGRFSTLLKSLLAVTRVIPAYRYSRRQNPDSWTVGHRLYIGEPLCNSLGDKFKQLKIGTISMPIGVYQTSVAYRTVMTISPQLSNIDRSMMINSDYYGHDYSPKHVNRNQSSDDNNSKSSISEEGPKLGAFVIDRRESTARSDTDQSPVPFSSLLNARTLLQHSPSPTNAVNGNELCERLKTIELADKDDANGNVPVTKSVSSCNGDFIVVDMAKPPFAEPSGNIELGTFCQEWRVADSLEGCTESPKVSDQVGDLTSQLADYENSMEEFDNVVTSLCDGGKDKNENAPPSET